MVGYWIKRINEEKHPLRFIISRILWHTGACRLFIIRRKDYFLRFYPTAYSVIIWTDPSAMRFDEDFFEDYLQPGDTVIDIGANIGSLSLKAAVKVGTLGKVIAFEAHPRISRFLEKNIELNKFGNITVHNIALGEKNETICFSDKRLDDRNSVMRDGNGIFVEMRRLDDVLISQSEISLMKIDVEGYEKHVLEGGTDILETTKCVYFEVGERHFNHYGYSTEDVLSLLIGQGFAIYKLSGRMRLSPINRSYSPMNTENLLAIKNIDEFTQRTGYKVKS